MSQASPYVRSQLTQICLQTGFLREAWDALLRSMGHGLFVAGVATGASALAGVSNMVEALSNAGMLDDELLDQLTAHPLLQHSTEHLDDLRVELGLRAPPHPVVDDGLLDDLKRAALTARMHKLPNTSLLVSRVPLELRQRVPTFLLSDAAKVRALFDAANRQLLEPGDELWMARLIDEVIELAEPLHHGALRDLREVVLMASKGATSAARGFVDASAGTLQAIVQRYGILLDGGTFLDRMRAAMARVCLIRLDDADAGTGFLVGPDLVLTNHHVVMHVLNGEVEASSVEFVFDYRRQDDQMIQGPRARLHTPEDQAAWLIDATPPTAVERTPSGTPNILAETPADELDFALLRLDRPVGAAHGRGWFELLHDPPFTFGEGTTLLVLGHPRKAGTDVASPLTFAIAADAFQAINPNQTRVQYRTNTLSGNSGSPVLSAAFEVVALHHYGRPNRYNQGIPVQAIADRARVREALAHQFRRQRRDVIGRRDDEDAALLLGHPGQEHAEHAARQPAVAGIGGQTFFHFVDPQHAGTHDLGLT